MKYRITRNLGAGLPDYKEGQVIDLSEAEAERLGSNAEPAHKSQTPKPNPKPRPERKPQRQDTKPADEAKKPAE